ncbi:diacylglyceryl transferase [Actinoplanes sp. SE50]|uniref:prolipoprotein diacylglyceryl transferase n=1 Tax=unclassified Actinoplanes TaxID=2626549 RepID=UPI00023ECFEA|nr:MULTISPECIES: prolipoprotein diacylglyceryl transferase [unclassified Actinoplanes]AEV82707.1 prolipoprotein diacylglyceryl transferase [Actinoplanes sp. SE50/110]ATO81103.1 diacylglyceryl transferase [Actinoplanes sp. SE50]SLL98510.1 Prolipoprotein diacylglyceryl transferase [Actinoplanes sp. SE50/110]
MNFALIPSPTTSVWHLGPLPIRAYALCIIAGMVVSTLLMEQRLRHRGVAPWVSLDLVVWAVPFGIIGARIYHLITSPQDYFGSGGDPVRALYIWEGGLGIWGAVAGGALGAWIAARQIGLPLSIFADSLAPALPIAQAIGRFGNWFNNELYGKVTTAPWGLQVHEMDSANPGHASQVDGQPITLPDLYHPTFLYEAIWDLGVGGLVWLLDRRFKFGRGRAFALYVMAYTAGRCWIEALRTDEANHFFGIRLNVFTSIVVFLGALIYFIVVRGPRAYAVPIDAPDTEPVAAAPAASAAEGGVSTVDVDATPAVKKAPVAYQIVTEDRFRAYQETGVLPPETTAGHDDSAPQATPVVDRADEPASSAAPAAPVVDRADRSGEPEEPAGPVETADRPAGDR